MVEERGDELKVWKGERERAEAGSGVDVVPLDVSFRVIGKNIDWNRL